MADRTMNGGSNGRLPFFAQHAPGSIGERLFMLAYGSAQIVHMASLASDKPTEYQLKMLKAMPELAANLYVLLAAIDAALPPDVNRIEAPTVIREHGATEDAQAESRVRFVRQAYANYRAAGGLK